MEMPLNGENYLLLSINFEKKTATKANLPFKKFWKTVAKANLSYYTISIRTICKFSSPTVPLVQYIYFILGAKSIKDK